MIIPSNYKYDKYLDEWFAMVENGMLLTCVEQKLLVKLVKNKLDNENIIIKHDKIEEAIKIIEKHMEFTLYPWETFLISCTYGLFYAEDDSLVFNEYFIVIGRGAGKNGYLAGTSFYEMTKAHGIKKYNIDLVATSEDQAKTSFNDIYEKIEDSDFLQNSFDFTKEVIQNKSTKSKIEYNTSNAKTKDGKRPGHVKFDEIHAFQNYEQIKVYISALGKTPYPRITYITTQGYNRGGLLDELLALSKEILAGKHPHSRMLPFICKLDNEDEVDNPDNWVKANPSLLYDKTLYSTMVSEYENALLRPSLMLEFMTKRMNIPKEDAARSVTSWENILATNQEMPDLSNRECIIGIDYADIRDFCGCGVLIKENGNVYFKHHSFICSNSPHLKALKFDYKEAVRQGLATIIDGPSISASYIVDWVLKQASKYNIKKIAVDNFRYQLLREAFEKKGIYAETKDNPDGKLKLIRNGSWTHNMVAPLIDDLLANHKVVYGDDMMMRWYLNNTYTKVDGRGNKTYAKIEYQTRKNDGFMAFVHAMSLYDLLSEYTETVSFNSITL